MPPAFLVDRYKINYITQIMGESSSKGINFPSVLTQGYLFTDINQELYSKLRLGWKENEPKFYRQYIQWPVRFAFTCKSSRENDRRLKILKWSKFYDELVKLFSYEFQSEALDFAHDWVNVIKVNFKYDDWTKRYVSEHEEAHPVKGISWGQLLKYDKMNILSSYTKDFVGWWYDNFKDSGDWSLSQSTVNFGIRARSPDIRFMSYQSFILDRGRQIGFVPGPSTVNAFCRHDYSVKFMRKVFDYYEDKWGTRIISPKTEGGKAYTILRNEYLNGEILTNYDVAGMELITPSIIAGDLKQLPPGIGCCTSYLSNIPELLSGVGPTSDWDIIAHLKLLDKLIIKAPKISCFLGDDGTHVGGKIRNSILYERQEKDEAIHRTLGLTTTQYMHPVGLNITIDNAKHSFQVIQDHWIRNKLTFEERESIMNLFLGNVNGTPLYELIEKVEPQPFAYSPKQLLQYGLNIPIGI
jgi:hypothetical protein